MFPRLLPIVAVLFSVAGTSADTFVVTNPNDSGPGSLRQAITNANAHPNGAAADGVHFNIPSPSRTIVLQSALPAISDPIIIDGWTQPGWSGAPVIELTAESGLAIDGLAVTGGGTTVRGLVMNGFQAGIRISQNGSNTVQGCMSAPTRLGSSPCRMTTVSSRSRPPTI